MKKSDSIPNKESLEKEVKRLRKENAKLQSQREADKARMSEMKKELKKRRADLGHQRRTREIALEAVPGHRYSLLIVGSVF